MHTTWRIARAGLAAAVVVAVAGWAAERIRFGATDQEAVARIAGELRQRFAASADSLRRIAARVVADRALIASATRRQVPVARLFEVVEAALTAEATSRTGITVYDTLAAPTAWAGRTSDLFKERINGLAALLVEPGALGPRLVLIEPVGDRNRGRLATVVVEQQFGAVINAPAGTDTFTLADTVVPVSLRVRIGDVAPQGAYTFVIRSPGAGPLVDAEVSPAALAAARARWRRGTWTAVLSVAGITLLLCATPLLTLRRRARTTRTFVAASAGLVVAVVVARVVFWFAVSPVPDGRPLTSPLDLLLTAMALTAIVWVTLDSIERWRLVGWRRHRLMGTAEVAAWVVLGYTAAGIAVTAIAWLYERVLEQVSQTPLDLVQFSLLSLHPLNGERLALDFGLVLLHAGVIWSAVSVTRLPGVWRTRRAFAPRLAAAAWIAGVVIAVTLVSSKDPAQPIAPLLVAVAAAGAGAIAMSTLRRRARRAPQSARLVALFLALLVPALAIYPSMLAFTTAAKERLIATQYAPLAASQRQDLQDALYATLGEIDAHPNLLDLVERSKDSTAPTPDRAYAVWWETELRTYRLTSAVELYGANGRLVSRFALNLPEYTTAVHEPSGCGWDVLDEVLPFGSSQRHVLRASRGICDDRGRIAGAIVVSVMLDYRTLPFIQAQSPYLESLQPDLESLGEGAVGRDVEFVVYGWSRAPIYASGTSVWSLPDPVFQRLVESREPFWATTSRGPVTFRVFFMSDRGGIYALGYPVITVFGHLMNVAELIFLAGVLYVGLVLGATLINALTSRTPASGRALVREIRASFYRTLFLAFGAAAVVPVVILAIAIRTYFATQLRAGIEEAAAKTALVAQRLVEDYATLQQRGAGALAALDDQIMVLVRRAIDQDVNLFGGAQLQATSERDLFASGLLPRRTPAEVYRRIVLDRLPTFVGEQEGGYLLAAAPVRAGGLEGIVTVPVPLRQPEIERQIDDLDRQVLSLAVLFSLLGAALGYWMAERIADPINRLTRATKLIARGNLNARVATAASDELGRLIRDFNRMAEDLKRQRIELERTQRLEAWADMARQVAHDIKNPLTPIQLSAEHAQRVNLDRGRPLSPVLDECMAAILSQVRLLRQIAAEFSSFASAATPRPTPTRVADLVEEVIDPYRVGLAGRIAIEFTADDSPTINVDRTMLARAITNVFENALHAMPGTGRLITRVRTGGEDGPDGIDRPAVVIEITDTGIGMDAESMAKIFEPYFSTKAAGTGLGLTIAKRNVELNGGTIQVRSQKGVGTTVTLTFPIDPEPSLLPVGA